MQTMNQLESFPIIGFQYLAVCLSVFMLILNIVAILHLVKGRSAAIKMNNNNNNKQLLNRIGLSIGVMISFRAGGSLNSDRSGFSGR